MPPDIVTEECEGTNQLFLSLSLFVENATQSSVATSMTCERRERLQMIMNEEGDLLAMSSGVTGCPAFGVNKGDGDCFTLIQLMNDV